MKKSLLCIIMSIIMVTAAVQVTAHQNFAEPLMDFEAYTDTSGWNGGSVTTGSLPVATYGTFSAVSAQSVSNGITNAVADTSGYGNSVKMIQKYNSSSGACSGIKYTPDEVAYGTVSLKSSIYAESADDGNVILRGIYLRDSSGTSNVDAQAVTFRDDKKIYVFSSSTTYTWTPDSWYDISMIYNTDTEEYRITIHEDGDFLFVKEGSHTRKDLACITEIQIRSQVKCNAMITDSTPWDDQIFYLDNFSFKTDFELKFQPDDAENTDKFDFADSNSGTDFVAVKGGLGELYPGQGDFAMVSDSEKGTALSYTYKGSDIHSNSYVCHDISTKTAIADVYRSKASFMLKDYNFKEIRFRHFNTSSKRFGESLTITPKSTNILGTILKVPGTSDNYIVPKDSWIDFELSFNPEDGHIKACIFDGTTRYVVESDKYNTADYLDVPMYRTRIMYYNGLIDGCDSSTMIIDDIEIGYIDNMYEFSLVEASSTTGEKISLGLNDNVRACFTNKINKETFTESSVTMPYSDGLNYSLSFPDDYSVQINFNKEPGEHYHILFKNVADISGNTLTDFIEFNMAPPPYITGAISFADAKGASIRYLHPGEITASVTVMSGDDKPHTARMWAGLYNSQGDLAALSFESVKYDVSQRVQSVSINVPDDGEAYRLKSGVWTNELDPLAFGEVTSQVVIFKLDDLRYAYEDSSASYTYEDFVALAEWANNERVDLSFGLICNTLEDEEGIDKSGYYKAIGDMDASDYVEIWCHGYTHVQTGDAQSGYNAEFNAPIEDQIATLKACADIVYTKTGVTMHSLGVPHNIVSDDTPIALAQVPQFTTLLGSKEKKGDTYIQLLNVIRMEESTGVLYDLDYLKSLFLASSSDEYVIMTGHSGRWSDEDIAKFKELTSWLKTQNTVFMTPTEYYNFVK